MRIAKPLYAVTLTCGGIIAAAGLLVLVAGDPPAHAASCQGRNALGTSRTLVVDPAEHARLGAMQYRETLPLRPKEVVLTFDDGPLPPYSTRILDVLARECVKATYFLVGRMAKAYPSVVARIAAEGHTIGTHSQSHPLTFHRMSLANAQQEIQGGIASVSSALGGRQPAPFFRIPGLLRASPVEGYLASQRIMTWSADIPSDDWKRIRDKEIVRRTLARLEAQGKGMVLLHDIKPATALALPILLRELKARGYRIVHVVPASRSRPKTQTVASQWYSPTGARHQAQIERAEAELRARGGAWPRTLASGNDGVRQRQAARQRSTARMAVIDEGNDPEAVVSFHEQPTFLSNLLRLPWQLLQ